MAPRRTVVAFVALLAMFATACSAGDEAPPEQDESGTADQADDQAGGITEPDIQDDAEPDAGEREEAGRLETLRIRHPQTLAFAAPFAVADLDGPLGEVTDDLDVDQWATPDVLRSLLVNDESELTAVPTYVAANLHNRGVDVRMAGVVVWGLLWVLGPEGAEPDWDSLRGETVMVPFPNDMPDLVFRYLAEANGLVPGEDFEIEHYSQPPEVVAQLAEGGGDWAVLPEHVATMAQSRSREAGRPLGRVLDLQEEWAEVTGTAPRIPQAGVVVPTELAEDRPDVVAAMLDELERAVELVNAAEPDTIAMLSEASGVPAPLVEQVIPRLNLEVVPGGDARDELERFFSELASLSPDIIGGELPDASLYLDDPR